MQIICTDKEILNFPKQKFCFFIYVTLCFMSNMCIERIHIIVGMNAKNIGINLWIYLVWIIKKFLRYNIKISKL